MSRKNVGEDRGVRGPGVREKGGGDQMGGGGGAKKSAFWAEVPKKNRGKKGAG